MRGSLLIEVHRWKGFGLSRDLFSIALTLGFSSVIFSRESIIETIVMLKGKLEKAKQMLGGNL